MNRSPVSIYCDACERWITVEDGSEVVDCDCGNRYVVTVSTIPRSERSLDPR